jgi:hypothetical protein
MYLNFQFQRHRHLGRNNGFGKNFHVIVLYSKADRASGLAKNLIIEFEIGGGMRNEIRELLEIA